MSTIRISRSVMNRRYPIRAAGTPWVPTSRVSGFRSDETRHGPRTARTDGGRNSRVSLEGEGCSVFRDGSSVGCRCDSRDLRARVFPSGRAPLVQRDPGTPPAPAARGSAAQQAWPPAAGRAGSLVRGSGVRPGPDSGMKGTSSSGSRFYER